MSVASTFDRVASALRHARSVLLCAHVDPDGDAVGSTLGLMHILRQCGVEATPVLPNDRALPSSYAFLSGSERFVRQSAAPEADVFVALDSPSLDRLGYSEAIARQASTLIMIDHHPDADPPADALALLDPQAAAVGCLIWKLAPHLGVSPDASAATCLYTAVLTDTGRFSYSNTTAETLRIAAEMVDSGASPSDVYNAVYESRSAAAQALLGRALSRISIANRGRVAYSWIASDDFKETGALPTDTENLIDHVRAIKGVDVVFLVKLEDGRARVSLRSKSGFDVGSVARTLGGGGHRAAAGATISGGLEDALHVLLPLLPGAMR